MPLETLPAEAGGMQCGSTGQFPGSVHVMGDDLTRWRMNLADDSTITFDKATKTLTKISTGETCYLGDYPSFAVDGDTLFVSSGHAPKLGKWYVPG